MKISRDVAAKIIGVSILILSLTFFVFGLICAYQWWEHLNSTANPIVAMFLCFAAVLGMIAGLIAMGWIE